MINNNEQSSFYWLIWSLIIFAVLISIFLPIFRLYKTSLLSNSGHSIRNVNQSAIFLFFFICMIISMMFMRIRYLNDETKIDKLYHQSK